MEVKIGGTYMNGVGEKVGPLVEPYMSSYIGRFKGGDGIDLHYNADGSVFSASEPSKWDLVSEYPIGKTLTELDVKPGDVVRYVNTYKDDSDYFPSTMTFEIKKEGFITDALGKEWKIGTPVHKFIIVSRAPQPTAEPKRMHPDDIAKAITEYAFDCGYAVEVKLINGSGTHTYEI